MADQPDLPEQTQIQPYDPIAPEEATRFFNAHQLRTCEVCSTNHWTVDYNSPGMIPIALNQVTTPIAPAISVCVVMVCTECGNTKLFNTMIMREWLRKHPK